MIKEGDSETNNRKECTVKEKSDKKKSDCALAQSVTASMFFFSFFFFLPTICPFSPLGFLSIFIFWGPVQNLQDKTKRYPQMVVTLSLFLQRLELPIPKAERAKIDQPHLFWSPAFGSANCELSFSMFIIRQT